MCDDVDKVRIMLLVMMHRTLMMSIMNDGDGDDDVVDKVATMMQWTQLQIMNGGS